MHAPDHDRLPATLGSHELRALATLLDHIASVDGGASEGDTSVVMEYATVRIDGTGQHVTIGWDDGNWCLLDIAQPAPRP